MSNVRPQVSRLAKNYPLKRGAFIRSSLPNEIDNTYQRQKQDVPSSQENPTFAFLPLVYSTYTVVNVSILFYGLFTANLPLIYVACIMASAPAGPSVLKYLIPLVKEKFLPKDYEK